MVVSASIRAAILIALGSAASCGLLSPRPDPSRYFTLVAVPAGGSPVKLAEGTAIGIGPVRVAEYLDRPALTVRVQPTEIERIGVDRWAEPLDSMLVRVISEDLSARLPGARLVRFPWYPEHAPALQVRVSIVSLERDGNRALVAADWQVIDPRSEALLFQRSSRFDRPIASSDPNVLVEGLSAGLGDLASEIAAELARQPVAPAVRD